ncbi:hypothetical protein C8Q75DRAFT_725270 [Abortiporus biennis]|nr:hypothetical protein C8Q75DRAFT_725270 [Abortiporus biennis]
MEVLNRGHDGVSLGGTKLDAQTRHSSKMQKFGRSPTTLPQHYVPFGVTYEKIGTIQRRLAWPLHKDDTLFRSGRPTGLNIYCPFYY